ncbi:MAG: hypothetical protein JWM87_3677 [Candidatus Eremiobacteraeota bacterium]|nr:hypothetical protein [Candidatus Eremiobacteraeota bacterium]
MDATPTAPAGADVDDSEPAPIFDVEKEYREQPSRLTFRALAAAFIVAPVRGLCTNCAYFAGAPLERCCKNAGELISSPLALVFAILFNAIWMPLGIIFKFDPYPFALLLTFSNVVQLLLIFVLAVGQRQAVRSAEQRAEQDHQSIVDVLACQKQQERMLLRITAAIEANVEDVKQILSRLPAQDAPA